MGPKYRHLLVPIDGSPGSERGIVEAIALARALGARLRFVHVLDPRLLLADFTLLATGQMLIEQQRVEGEALLERARARAHAAGLDAEGRLLHDPPLRVADLILGEAARWPADLIVMGTHGRSGLSRFALGSDAEAVLHASPVPLLLARAAPPSTSGDEHGQDA